MTARKAKARVPNRARVRTSQESRSARSREGQPSESRSKVPVQLQLGDTREAGIQRQLLGHIDALRNLVEALVSETGPFGTEDTVPPALPHFVEWKSRLVGFRLLECTRNKLVLGFENQDLEGKETWTYVVITTWEEALPISLDSRSIAGLLQLVRPCSA